MEQDELSTRSLGSAGVVGNQARSDGVGIDGQGAGGRGRSKGARELGDGRERGRFMYESLGFPPPIPAPREDGGVQERENEKRMVHEDRVHENSGSRRKVLQARVVVVPQ